MPQPTLAALTWIGGECGHEIGDYLAQLDRDARRKQGWAYPHKPAWNGDNRTPCERAREGKTSLARHATTYALSQLASRFALNRTAGITPPTHAVVLACAVEGVVHAVIDDGRLLDRFANATGKDRFGKLGTPRQITAIVDDHTVTRHVELVHTDHDGNILYDENGHRIPAGPHDNPTLATGKWAMDQALHRSVQLFIGTATAVWATRRASRKGGHQ